MVLNTEKLTTVLKEITSCVDIASLKHRQTCPVFVKIFASYNKDQPTRLKLANNLKNRKMVLKRIMAIHNNNTNRCFVKEKCENLSAEINKKLELDTAESLNLLQSGIYLIEEFAANALLELKNSKKAIFPSSSEKSAAEALLSLSKECKDLEKNTKCFENNQPEIYVTPEISTFQEEKVDAELPDIKTIKEFDKILQNFSNDFKTTCNNFIDKFEFINSKNKNILNKNNEVDYNLFSKNVNSSILSHYCDKEETFENKTLGSFETESDSFDLCLFESYRKSPNPKEKVSKNVIRMPGKLKKPIRRFNKKIPDCKFKVDPDLIFKTHDHKKLKPNRNEFVIDVLTKEYSKENNTCIIAIYNIKYLLSSLLAYGYCTFPDCCCYRFKVHYDGTVFVYRTGEVLLHGQGQTRVSQLRGVSRQFVKKSLREKSAYIYRKEKILEASDEVAQSGNFQNIHNLSTLRKCKSEQNFDTFCDPNAFIDVYRMQQQLYKEYIQYVASPLAIHCWANKTFETFKENPQILKDANHTIHFDATGQSVRQIECAAKRILIYKMVIRIKKFRMIIPIVTAILSRHTMMDISLVFEKLQLYCKEHKFKWPFFERVCTDVSYALFGGILKICNEQSVSEYLNACFKHIENPLKNSRPKVIIQWCKAHYIHIICSDLKNKIGKTHVLRNLLKNALTMAFDLKTMDECKFWFRNMFTVLLSPQKSPEFKESYTVLRKHIMEINEDEVNNLNIFENEQINNLESIASRSPFKRFFENMCNNLNESFKDDRIKYEINEFQNEDICKFILKKYCSFLPMWTNILGIKVDSSGDHISNAPVEFNFYLQKHILLNNKSVRPGDFIKIDRKDSMSSLKELRYKYDMFDIQKQEEKITEDTNGVEEEKNKKSLQIAKEHDYDLIEYLEPEETWKKKNPKTQKAIKPRHLLNAKKPKKFSSQSKSVEDIIQIDVDNVTKKEDYLRIEKEHTYSVAIKSKVVEKYFLFKYNNLFEAMYPTLKLSDIGFWNILDLEDWKSLTPGERLTNLVLDCAMISILKENFKNVISLPCQINKICFENVTKLLPSKPNYIVIPILNNEHFNLCILNYLKKEFIFIDSLSDIRGEEYFEGFSSHFSEEKLWNFSKILKRTIQDDLVSCGVYVIMYTLHYLRGKSLLRLPSSTNFRKTIKSVLIRNADNCSGFCCHCGNFKRTRTKCNSCQYAVCEKCIKELYDNNFIKCKICTNKLLK